MDTKKTNEERLAAAHAVLSDAVARVATSDDWQNLLRISGSFHRYSPNNQLLLAAQGAEGLVASFSTWTKIPAIDGEACRIRRGEKALRVYAPTRTVRREIDDDTGQEITETTAVRFKLVAVFHQGQLAAPPDLPVQPKLLEGQEPSRAVWEAVAEQIATAGYALRRGQLQGPDGPKGVTNFVERTVIVRDDLSPAQALKTQIHELGHVLMHFANVGPGDTRERMEVEAESVAYVVCDILGVDAGSYSIPYVANWAGGDAALVQATAQKVLAVARQIVTGLETELGVDLRPNPFTEASPSTAQPRPESAAAEAPPVANGQSTDEIIFQHLATGTFDWQRLAASIPAVETERSKRVADDVVGQAIVLAEAGASPEANTAMLRSRGMDNSAIVKTLTVSVPDSLGASSTLYPPADVERTARQPRELKPIVDGLVADLVVSIGRHPGAVRYLAASSNQPATVVNLIEERLRRNLRVAKSEIGRSSRGLSLIDEWCALSPQPATTPTTEMKSIDQSPHPDLPSPPAA